jgi:hypothetical protein
MPDTTAIVYVLFDEGLSEPMVGVFSTRAKAEAASLKCVEPRIEEWDIDDDASIEDFRIKIHSSATSGGPVSPTLVVQFDAVRKQLPAMFVMSQNFSKKFRGR